MMLFAVGAGVAALTGRSLYRWLHSGRRRALDLREMAAEAGLTEIATTSSGPFGVATASGQLGPRLIRIAETEAGEVKITVQLPTRLAFTLQAESGTPEAYKAADMKVGDEEFDSVFFAVGHDAQAMATLDAATRELLLSRYGDGDVFVDGNLLRISAYAGARERCRQVLRETIALSSRLVEQSPIATRLARNAGADPNAAVRVTNLLTLLRDFADDPRAKEALRAALGDKSPLVRLRAALAAGKEGRPALVKLAESRVQDQYAAEAVEELGEQLSRPQIDVILDRAWRDRRPRTARACISYLGRVGDPAAIQRLTWMLSEGKGPLGAAAAAAATALGEAGVVAAEPALIAALQRDPAELRLAAARALARVGTVAAVPPLAEVADGDPEPELARAARQAIAEIQGRLENAARGQLSLAAGDAGRLSLAPGEPGQVSLPRRDRGELSLPTGDEE